MTLTLASHPIPDAGQRQQALNTTQSFIVQAPAGSGKTELLTQRFLVLLAQVNAPEEILAITFTKKAAAEMRARIIKTLKHAATEPEPESAHAQKTWQLARHALQKSRQLNWDLLQNPSRLRIQTIDSFNSSLVKRLPILSQFGAPPDITDDALPLYRAAIAEFPKHLESEEGAANAIAQLLQHCDNDINRIESLLMAMLQKRDQWLPFLAGASNTQSLRDDLEAHLRAVVGDIFAKLKQIFPQEHTGELAKLLNFAGRMLQESDSESILTLFADLTELPPKNVDNLDLWLAIKDFLFTKELTWRKSFTKNQGFPAPSSAKGAEKLLYGEMKKRMENIMAAFTEDSQLLAALTELHYAPAHQYSDYQWQVLLALHQILILAVSELYLVFSNVGKVDFIQNALAALTAMGDEEAPTDLALAMDYQIKHILIDEFQDTSSSQYRLLKILTAGWQVGDGRTLFIVGDPMQSIYRFREADVGLFIRARKQGIGDLKLIPLTLAVNFRSKPQIVSWVNDNFQHIFPAYEDIATGAVSYNKSIANEGHLESDSAVKLHVSHNADDAAQAKAIVSLILERRRKLPDAKIAILVRARTHLKNIIPALKQANLLYRAIKIDSLHTRPVIQDLMALTRGLLNPADKVAWLAIMRAPWCGLTLADLLVLAQEPALYQAFTNATTLRLLSLDGQKRLARVGKVLTVKMAERQRLTLAMWVKSTWLMLGGPACLEQDAELNDVTTYFSLLEKLDRGGNLTNLNTLQDAVEKLYAAPNSNADDSLQIMTIHNAKGLEFDTVILPFLEKKSAGDDKQLLHFMEKTREQAANALILAPLPGVGEEDDKIYSYVKYQHKTKNEHETARLLYVAATRAKQHLHLFMTINPERNADSSSLLHKLLPAIGNELNPSSHDAAANLMLVTTKPERAIQRLTTHWQNPLQEIPLQQPLEQQILSNLQTGRDNARYTGTVVHLILQQISRLGLSWWLDRSRADQQIWLKNQLLQAGILAGELAPALANAALALENTLRDERGLWILQSHADSQTEFAVTVVIVGCAQQVKIDKTFVDDQGKRWIIDFKTTPFFGNDLEIFLASEQQKHSEQMRHYYQAMHALDEKPIHLGLYFPLIPAWREWVF
jgi:ATP-dependent helicase/nuclease subunit A